MPDKKDYPVGYKNPPKHTQFRKGKSPNPGGRPRKKQLDMQEIIERVFTKGVRIKENGKERKISMLEASLLQVANKGMGGDFKAIKIILDILKRFPPAGKNSDLDIFDRELDPNITAEEAQKAYDQLIKATHRMK